MVRRIMGIESTAAESTGLSALSRLSAGLGRLDESSEQTLIEGILDSVADACGPCTTAFVPCDRGRPAVSVVRPESVEGRRAVADVVNGLGDPCVDAILGDGFAVRVAADHHTMGVLVVVGLADSQRAPGLLALFGAMRGVLALAIRGARSRQELARREEELQVLVEDATDVVYTVDDQACITWVSPSVTRTLGWRVEQVIGHPVREFIHPDDLVARSGERRRLQANGGQGGRTELRYATADGGWRWMSVAGRATYDDDGRLVRGRESLRDIDELVRAGEAVAAEQHRLRVTLDSLLDPHVFLEAVRDDSGQIVDFVYRYANEAACAYNQRRREDMVGARLLDVLPGHASSGILAQYAAVVDTGVPILVDGLTYYNEVLGRSRRSDVRGVRIEDGISLTWRDVTERYDAADALQESELRYRLLAEHASDLVYLTGPDRGIRWISPSVTGALGWRPDELIGTEAVDLVHPDDRGLVGPGRERAYTGEPVDTGDTAGDGDTAEDLLVRVRTRSGTYRWMVGANAVLRADDGTVLGVAGSMRDVDELVLARQEAQTERLRLRATMDTLLDPHALLDSVRDSSGALIDFEYVDVNPAACAFLGLAAQALIGRRLADLDPSARPPGQFALYAGVLESGYPLILDGWLGPREVEDREPRAYDIRVARVGDGLSQTWRDVTDRTRAASAVAESERRYHLLADNVTDIVWLVHHDRVAWVSPSVTAGLGWSVDELIGIDQAEVIHPDDREAVRAARAVVESGQTDRHRYRIRSREGLYRWVDGLAGPFRRQDGVQEGMVISMRLADAEVRAQEALERRARQDMLTGLANREEAFAQLEAILARSVRTGIEIAVVFCDIDDFKTINDSYGHAAGDELLRAVADRIRANVRTGDVVARIGGDELLLVLDGVHSLQEAERIADHIRTVVRRPIPLRHSMVRVSVSLGVTLAMPGEAIDALVARSDRGMYQAKQAGRNRVVAL